MSSEGVAWVFRHSPYVGSILAVHLAVGDSVNDQNGNEFWMVSPKLAAKARVGRSTAMAALARLVEDGFLQVLSTTKGGRNMPTRYRFLFPNVEVVFDSRGTETVQPPDGIATETVQPPDGIATETVQPPAKTVQPPDTQRTQRTQVLKPRTFASKPEPTPSRFPNWSDDRRKMLEALPVAESEQPEPDLSIQAQTPQVKKLRESLG